LIYAELAGVVSVLALQGLSRTAGMVQFRLGTMLRLRATSLSLLLLSVWGLLKVNGIFVFDAAMKKHGRIEGIGKRAIDKYMRDASRELQRVRAV